MNRDIQAFWSLQTEETLSLLQTTPDGLTTSEAQKRLTQYGPNLLKPEKRTDAVTLLLSQFKSPIIIILLLAALASVFLHDAVEAIIIFAIISISSLLGFWQEKGAANSVQKLIAMVSVNALVLRDGRQEGIPIEQVVPGDIVVVEAGSLIPGDSVILESRDLFVDEATLTGETYPVAKSSVVLDVGAPLKDRINSLFMGTHVISGSANALVVNTGKETEFGKISERLKLKPPETEFERGVRRFGYLLMEVTLLLVIAIFVINVYFSRPILDSFMFSLALAVGLTPQLLPAIISINLAYGAKHMAAHKVIVKRLASIEDFGSMNVLCSDKTGTLTEGLVKLHSAIDLDGHDSDKVLLYAYLNSLYQAGYINPIDQAIQTFRQFDVAGYHKLDEVPYDFVRKRLSVLIADNDTHLMVTKGSVPNLIAVCSSAEDSSANRVGIDSVREQIQRKFEELSSNGFRTLGLAYRDLGSKVRITKEDETDMTFLGLLVFFDPPKAGIAGTVGHLRALGISLKMVTGDSKLVALFIGQKVGLSSTQVLTGQDLRRISNEALLQQVNSVDIFAEVEPNQKERIILALKKSGNVVGYMGDAINDASALHAADVGLSVDSAVDVAKDAADFVLLEKNLEVLVDGVQQGRRAFANTLKYVFMATSANFGNMFSMAGASLFLSFLPLLPKQILLTNLMTDFPEMTISTDSVDPELIEKPRRWDIKFIRRFMIVFGLLSTVFDFATFGVLLLILNATTDEFRAGWFVESVVSASLIVLVIRSRRSLFKSRPGKYLLVATLAVCSVAVAIPFTGLGHVFGFTQIPGVFFLYLLGIVVLYLVSAETLKKLFYRRLVVVKF